jgi:hypothetical protein
MNMSSEELCKFAETRYRHLLEAGKWRPTPVTSSAEMKVKDEKDKENPKFLALVVAVKELVKNATKSSENADAQKNKWKFEPPAAGASIEKQVNGKTFRWCDGSDGKHHKPMYCCLQPSECKEQGKSKENQGQNGNGNGEAKLSQNAKGVTPKLKLNNNLATALAALDSTLQSSTGSDVETSSNPDLQ